MGTCDEFVTGLFTTAVDALKNARTGSTYTVPCTVVSNQNNQIAGFAEGLLAYVPASSDPNSGDPFPMFSGALSQYFSDRRYNAAGGGTFVFPYQPFDQSRTDQLRVYLFQDPQASNAVMVQFVLLTWGNATFSFTPECQAGVLYGVGSPVGGGSTNALYVVSVGVGSLQGPITLT